MQVPNSVVLWKVQRIISVDDGRNHVRLTRRGFFKAVAAGGMALAAGAAGPARAGAGAEELVTVLDLSKCIGCGACVQACRESNAHKFPEPVKPFPAMSPAQVKAEDWSGKRDVDDRLTPYNWLYIQTAEVQWNGETRTVHIPRRCLHCQNPPCANLCPWGAAGRQENGIVRIDDRTCLGGAKCRDVCPWSIPQRQTGVGLYLKLMPRFAGNGVMYKCDRCRDLVAQGQTPRCIEACPQGVQQIGPRPEMVALAKALAAETGGFLYGLGENGGTNTIYVSPVPFDVLDKAVAKGPGQPHLAGVADTMADETKLAAAALVAPVAGLVGGLLRAGRTVAEHADKDREGRP